MFKRFVLILSIISVLLIQHSVFAQPATPAACAGAQAWYDSIDAETYRSYLGKALDNDARNSARFQAVEDLRQAATDLEDSRSPACLDEAKAWYIAGLNKLSESMEAMIDDEIGDFALSFSIAAQFIGQFRGYLVAIGVEVNTEDTDTIFFK